MTRDETGKLAVLWRGDRQARADATPANNRFYRVFEELASVGIHAEPAVYAEEMTDEVRAQLLQVDGVLVWVDPLSGGRNRVALDALLRDVSNQGVWVSAHPDVTLKMGVKEVLYRTKQLGWETDSSSPHRECVPRRIPTAPSIGRTARSQAESWQWWTGRVKVEHATQPADGAPMVYILEARRGSVPETMALADFMRRCEAYFGPEGCIIDQPFQPRLPDGMIRCYMGADKVVGFGHQLIKALIAPPPEGPESETAQPGPRIMHPASAPMFQALRLKMETEWTPEMMRILGVERDSLPIIWDADFLYGPRNESGADTYVLCEINVSSVFAIPDDAPAAIARLALARLQSSKTSLRA